VLIFPEGSRSAAGGMARFKRGAALLAIDSAVPIVPIGTRGLFAIMPKGLHLVHPGRAEVQYGQPLEQTPGESYSALTARAEAAVRGLVGAQADQVVQREWSY
jgi:1-acyl-sn-glycerol-3-phosphate acyltransferase